MADSGDGCSSGRTSTIFAKQDRTLEHLDRTLDGVGGDLKEVREQGSALTAAVLAFLDRLDNGGDSAPAT